MLGVADREIFLQGLSEETVRPFLDDDVRILEGLDLVFLDPNLAVHLEGEEIRARELRIVRIFIGPRQERVVGPVDVRDEARVGRVSARADQFVAKRVIDAQITHLHPAEVLVSGCGDFQHVVNMLLPLRDFGRVVFF